MSEFDNIRDRLDEVERRAVTANRPDGTAVVYEDPVTGKLYDGYGEDAAPIEEVPEVGTLVVQTRTMSMERAEAVAEGYEIVEELCKEDPRLDVVAVRVPHADSVDTEAAATLDDDPDDRRTFADFTDTQT